MVLWIMADRLNIYFTFSSTGEEMMNRDTFCILFRRIFGIPGHSISYCRAVIAQLVRA